MARSRVAAVAEAASSGSAAAAASPPKTGASSALTSTARRGASAAALSRRARAPLPEPMRFSLVVVLSFAITALGLSFVHFGTNGELGSIARRPESRAEMAALAAWKIFGLTIGWFGDFDGYDLASLAVLSSGPATYLCTIFYGISALTAGAYLAVDVASALLPFLLLRQLSGAHSAAPHVPNREIVTDRGLQVLTSVLAGLVYSVVFFLAARTYLPNTLVLYFNGIPTIRPAADALLLGVDRPVTQLFSLLFGIATRAFIFTPLVTTPRSEEEEREIASFDPAAATLGETIAYNLWGFTSRTKVSIKRTAVAMLFAATGTCLQCTSGIQGVEPYGAAVYASVWVIAALATGLSLRYVGSI